MSILRMLSEKRNEEKNRVFAFLFYFFLEKLSDTKVLHPSSIISILRGSNDYFPNLLLLATTTRHLWHYLRKLGKYTLVQWQADRVVLFDGGIEETFHHAVIAQALDDVALQAMLGGDARGHEPLQIEIKTLKFQVII